MVRFLCVGEKEKAFVIQISLRADRISIRPKAGRLRVGRLEGSVTVSECHGAAIARCAPWRPARRRGGSREPEPEADVFLPGPRVALAQRREGAWQLAGWAQREWVGSQGMGRLVSNRCRCCNLPSHSGMLRNPPWSEAGPGGKLKQKMLSNI